MNHYTNNLHRVFVDQKIGFKKKITPKEQDLNFFNQVKKQNQGIFGATRNC